MSLINDALRKARQAASERSAQQPDSPFRGARRHPTRQNHRGSRLAAVILIAAAAAVVGASAAWWAAGRQAERDEFPEVTRQADARAGERPGNAPPAAGAAPLQRDGENETGLPGVDAAQVAEQAPPPEATRAPLSPQPRPSQAQNLSPTTPAEPSAEPPHTATSTGRSERPSQSGSTGSDRVFILEADLGYATLSLDYIVFRPGDPFAEINGIEVHEGWFVDDFVVDKIERDRVILHDEKGPLTLRVP